MKILKHISDNHEAESFDLKKDFKMMELKSLILKNRNIVHVRRPPLSVILQITRKESTIIYERTNEVRWQRLNRYCSSKVMNAYQK